MSQSKSKISFDMSPSIATTREEHAADKAQGRQSETPARRRVSFDAVQQTPAEQSEYSIAAKAEDVMSEEQHFEEQTVWVQEVAAQTRRTLADSVPQTTGMSGIGFMAPPQPGFMARNAMPLGVAAAVVLTFVAGIGTAMFLLGDRVSLQASAQLPPLAPVTETATRALTPDLTDVGPNVDLSGSEEALAKMVLAGLRPRVTVPVDELQWKVQQSIAFLNATKLRMLREGVLADVYDIATYEFEGVERIRLRFINAKTTTDVLSAFLVDAVNEGRVDLAKSLRTPTGSVDVDTMMFNLVQMSLRRDGNRQSDQAARNMSRKIFAASVARTEYVDGTRVYTVKPGDSLAYISLQLYGMPSAYKRIMEANQDTLQSPDKIQVGQRLIIPS